MMEFSEPWASGSAGLSTAGAGLSSGSGSGSCFLLPLTFMTVSTVACMPWSVRDQRPHAVPGIRGLTQTT